MDPRLPFLLFGSFGALLFLSFPIAAALGISSVLVIAVFDLAPLELIPQQLLSATDSWTLLAVPFFILAGNLLAKTAISERLVRLARVVVGQFPAGLAMVAVIVSIFFAGISGSGPADTAALGAILIPGMVAAGYDRRSAAALMAAGGGIGIVIPPSIALVIYGVVANASISKLFIAGILPGILVGLSLFVVSYLLFGKDPDIRPEKRGSLREIGAAFKDAAWGLLAPLIILGGIYGGIFTPTEAAGVAAVYAFFIAVFVYRDVKFTQVPKVLVEASKVTVMLMFIIANALLFAHVLTTERIPQAIAEQIVSWGMPAWGFLIVVNLLLLAAGAFMEPTGIILILAPILFPIATQLGIDPVHLGIIMVVNLEIGMVTPPVGLNLFVTAGITRMSIGQVVHAALPWLMVLLVFLVIVTYVPQITLALPNLLF